MKRLLAFLLLIALLMAGCAPADFGEASPDNATGEKNSAGERLDPNDYGPASDATLSSALRETFVGFDTLYLPACLPVFQEGETPELKDVLYYLNVYQPESFVSSDGASYITREKLNQLSNALFGVTYDVGAETLNYSCVDYESTDLVRLAAYHEEEQDGLKRITVKLLYYDIYPRMWGLPWDVVNYYHYDQPSALVEQIYALDQKEEGSFYQAARQLMISDETPAGDPYRIVHLTFLSEDGTTPKQFLSCISARKNGEQYDYATGGSEATDTEVSMDPADWNENVQQTAVDPELPGGAEDSTVTAEQRKFYQAFCEKYFLAAMRSFKEGEQLPLDEFKFYVSDLHRDRQYYKEGINFAYLPGELVEQEAALFGWSYGLGADSEVPLGFDDGTSNDYLYELVAYKEAEQNGQKRITVKIKAHRCNFNSDDPKNYNFIYYYALDYTPNTLAIYEKMKQENLSYYEAACRLVVQEGNLPEPAALVYHLTYLTQDGETPTRFVSLHSSYYDSQNGGYSYYDEATQKNVYYP